MLLFCDQPLGDQQRSHGRRSLFRGAHASHVEGGDQIQRRLAANQYYYVFTYDNAGTRAGAGVDTDTGIEIKTGDPTRTLV